MKRLKGILAIALIVVIPAAVTFTVGWRPLIGPRARPVTDRKFESSPARLARGDYLVQAMNGCFFCHSERDPNQPDGSPKPGREGAGAMFTTDPALGTVYAPNITPDAETGIGKWTDNEIARAVREGVDRSGNALFPIMPYINYRHMQTGPIAVTVVLL